MGVILQTLSLKVTLSLRIQPWSGNQTDVDCSLKLNLPKMYPIIKGISIIAFIIYSSVSSPT